MNILSLDTSTSTTSIALKTDTTYEERLIENALSPSEDLLLEIKSMLKRVNLALSDLNLLACTKGPGSFTGLRIALSTMKGISLGASIPLVSIPTLDCFVKAVDNLYSGSVLAVIDAKKKRFYFSLWECGEKVIVDKDESAELILEELKKRNKKTLITGPDAKVLYEKLLALDSSLPLLLDTLSPRNISKVLIDLAIERLETHGQDDIGEGPVYIRRSDAEEMLIQKSNEAAK